MLNIDSIKPELLNSGFLHNVLYFEEISSTNDIISSPAIPADTLVIAEHQFKGKGRDSAIWESEKSKNLTFSLKKDYRKLNPENNSVLNYFSYCIFITLNNFLAENGQDEADKLLWIKWPNDVYYGNRKLCGILSETKFGSGVFVIGIGINCNQENFSEKLNAVSIKQITGKEIDLNRLLLNLFTTFSENSEYLSLNQKDELFKKWKKHTKMIGKECSFHTKNNIINNGIIKDLNIDGSISIGVNDVIKKFYSGELKLTSFK